MKGSLGICSLNSLHVDETLDEKDEVEECDRTEDNGNGRLGLSRVLLEGVVGGASESAFGTRATSEELRVDTRAGSKLHISHLSKVAPVRPSSSMLFGDEVALVFNLPCDLDFLRTPI